MWFLKTFVPFFALMLVVGAQHGSHGHGGGGHGGESIPSTGEVNAAFVNLGLHYNDKLCLELLLVDCATHVTTGDENVCGSDGVTYENHCKFTHAMCELAHSQTSQLSLASHGACPLTTAQPAGSLATMMATGSVGTNAPMATGSTMPPATTMATTTTVDPINAIVQSVFCKNAASISCADDFQIICGSDGQLYPNQCEMSKQKCNDPSLTVAEKSTCPIPGR